MFSLSGFICFSIVVVVRYCWYLAKESFEAVPLVGVVSFSDLAQ